jgi:hypothetical protein
LSERQWETVREDYSPYGTSEGIVARKSEELQRRKRLVESELDRWLSFRLEPGSAFGPHAQN